MSQPEHFEMLVLGSGEGGKYLAWHMAKSGHRTAVVAIAQTGRSCAFPGSVACVQRQAAGLRTPARWATITIKGEHTHASHPSS